MLVSLDASLIKTIAMHSYKSLRAVKLHWLTQGIAGKSLS
jgi:hypothetical protein